MMNFTKMLRKACLVLSFFLIQYNSLLPKPVLEKIWITEKKWIIEEINQESSPLFPGWENIQEYDSGDCPK
jgi:hypothetical protein